MILRKVHMKVVFIIFGLDRKSMVCGNLSFPVIYHSLLTWTVIIFLPLACTNMITTYKVRNTISKTHMYIFTNDPPNTLNSHSERFFSL